MQPEFFNFLVCFVQHFIVFGTLLFVLKLSAKMLFTFANLLGVKKKNYTTFLMMVYLDDQMGSG
jgi:hypothetical protein